MAQAKNRRGAKVAADPKPIPQVGVRLDGELLDLIDAEVERRRAEHPGTKISRSDVVREALYRQLRPPKK